MPAHQSKTATIVKLLRRPKGASIAQLQTATSWQAHSIRAALTRLRQQGVEIARDEVKGVSRYRIATTRKAA